VTRIFSVTRQYLDDNPPGPRFDPATDVDNGSTGTNTIDLGPNHGFHTGDAVVYRNGGGQSIGGLSDGETYFIVESVDPDKVRLASSPEEAAAGVVIDLDPSVATGTEHRLDPAVPEHSLEAGRVRTRLISALTLTTAFALATRWSIATAADRASVG
jgi:hypothetical protein